MAVLGKYDTISSSSSRGRVERRHSAGRDCGSGPSEELGEDKFEMRLATIRESSELGVLDEARSPSTADGVIEEDRMRFLRRIIGLRRRKESDTVGKEDSERILELGLKPSQIR